MERSHKEDQIDEIADADSLDTIIQCNVSSAVRNLYNFFSGNYVTGKGAPETNVINTSSKRTYYVPAEDMMKFFDLLDIARREDRMLHFAERQENDKQTHSGIMIDFDRMQPEKTSQFTNIHFDDLMKRVARVLKVVLDAPEIVCHMFIIRRREVSLIEGTTPPLYKDGLHLLVPDVQITRPVKRYINQELIKCGYIKEAFRGMTDADKMLDRMSASGPVLFLGNSKVGKKSYNLVHGNRFVIDPDTMMMSPIDITAVQHYNLAYELSLCHYATEDVHGRSTWLNKKPYDPREEVLDKIHTYNEKSSSEIIDDDELRKEEEDMSLITINNPRAKHLLDLLRILDISYASSYELWFKVICAVAHTGITEDYKSVAREFSRRRPESYSHAEFERVWSEAVDKRFMRQPVTFRSIRRWAFESSPEKCAEIEKNSYVNMLLRAIYDNEGRIEHAVVAAIAQKMCGDKYIVDVDFNEITGRTGYCWYEFVTSGQAMKKGEIFKYRKEANPDNLHMFIAEHMPKIYVQVRDILKGHLERSKDEKEEKYWASVIKNLKAYQVRLGNDCFQNGVIKQAHYRFRVRGFAAELDSYEYIMGVGNGVLKVGADPELIRGFHEFKISKYTDVDYFPYDKKNNPKIKILLNAFKDIFVEKDVYKFMLYHAATGLDHRESDCILVVCVGGGRNGKSFFSKMIHNTLGNMYCASGKATLLTSDCERGESANSAQMQQRGKNWFYIDEFKANSLLNDARVKMMTTPTWQSGRELHTRQTNFINTSNVICFSNFDFTIMTTDHGTWRRIYYYRNKTKFTENPDPANEYERAVNHNFIDIYANDPEYKQAMLSIMVHYHAKLHRKYGGDLKRVPVPTIVRETEDFRNRQDTINKFITEMIVVSPGAPQIGLTFIAGKYIEWYNKNIRPTKQTVQDCSAQFENSRLSGKIKRERERLYLTGYRIKDHPDEALGEDEMTIHEAEALAEK